MDAKSSHKFYCIHYTATSFSEIILTATLTVLSSIFSVEVTLIFRVILPLIFMNVGS